MRKVKYLLAFICLMLVSCSDRYNQTKDIMTINSVTALSDKLHLYELHISISDKNYYWVLELVDDAGKYNVGDTLIIGKK